MPEPDDDSDELLGAACRPLEALVPLLFRVCVVCGKPGVRYNAKTHPGACARVRKTGLQQLRRARRRRTRGTP